MAPYEECTRMGRVECIKRAAQLWPTSDPVALSQALNLYIVEISPRLGKWYIGCRADGSVQWRGRDQGMTMHQATWYGYLLR